MSEIMAIASGTWKNILRMKVVYFLILCVWILIGSAALYEVLSMGQHKPLMIDVSLALNAVAAALVVISITFEIPRELRQGVASTLLTKSLGRTQYLAGKLIGIAFAAIVICALITFGSFVIFSYTFSESIALPMFQAQLLQILSIIPMAQSVFSLRHSSRKLSLRFLRSSQSGSPTLSEFSRKSRCSTEASFRIWTFSISERRRFIMPIFRGPMSGLSRCGELHSQFLR